MRIKCPKCKKTYDVEASMIGDRVQCECSHKFLVNEFNMVVKMNKQGNAFAWVLLFIICSSCIGGYYMFMQSRKELRVIKVVTVETGDNNEETSEKSVQSNSDLLLGICFLSEVVGGAVMG